MMGAVRDVSIRAHTIRLGQVLKLSGLAGSGGEVHALIENGVVRVNGEVETRRGRQLRRGDVVASWAIETTTSNEHRDGGHRQGAQAPARPSAPCGSSAHLRRPERRFEDSDLAVVQFRVPHCRPASLARAGNDERCLTRGLTRFDRTAAQLRRLPRPEEKRGRHEQAFRWRRFAACAHERHRRERLSPLDYEDDRPYGRWGIPFPEGVSDVSETRAAALARDGGRPLCFVRRAGKRVVCAYPAAQQRRTEAAAGARRDFHEARHRRRDRARALRDGAVSGRKIASGSVLASDLGGGSVRTAALATGAVTEAKLAPDSVTAAQLSLPVGSVQAFSAVLPANQPGFRLIGATCPPGQRVVGGGGGWVTASSVDAVGFGVVAGSRPTPIVGTDSQNGWEVHGTDAPHPIDRRLMVMAICIAT
jgi:ribosome-associated protein